MHFIFVLGLFERVLVFDFYFGLRLVRANDEGLLPAQLRGAHLLRHFEFLRHRTQLHFHLARKGFSDGFTRWGACQLSHRGQAKDSFRAIFIVPALARGKRANPKMDCATHLQPR